MELEIEQLIAATAGILGIILKLLQNQVQKKKKSEEQRKQQVRKKRFYDMRDAIRDSWHRHAILELENRHYFQQQMSEIVNRHQAAYVQFLTARNGGDHITARKPYTFSALYEKRAVDGESHIEYVQGIRVGDEQSEIFLKALIDRYVYIEDFSKAMKSSPAKNSLDPKVGGHVGWFYIGCIGIEHYFLFCHFERAQTPIELERLCSICDAFYHKMRHNDDLKSETEALEREKDKLYLHLKKQNIL